VQNIDSVGWLILGGDGRVAKCSDEALSLLGVSSLAEAFPEGDVLAHGVPDERTRAILAMGEVLEQPGGTVTDTFSVRRPDGETRRVRVSARNEIDDPEVGGVVVVFRDVTDEVFEGGRSRRRAGGPQGYDRPRRRPLAPR
jgi:PAS domain-containing protein